MPKRIWGSSKLAVPECDSGALPAELQPRKTKRVLPFCPSVVKRSKAPAFRGQKNGRERLAKAIATERRRLLAAGVPAIDVEWALGTEADL